MYFTYVKYIIMDDAWLVKRKKGQDGGVKFSDTAKRGIRHSGIMLPLD